MKTTNMILGAVALATLTTASVKADVSLTFGPATMSGIGANSLTFDKTTATLKDGFGLVNLQQLTWAPGFGGGYFSASEPVVGGSGPSGLNLTGLTLPDFFAAGNEALYLSGVDAASTLSDLSGTTASWTGTVGGKQVSIWLVSQYFTQKIGSGFGGTRYLEGLVNVSAVPETSTVIAGIGSLGLLALGFGVHSKRSVFRIG